MTRLHQRVLALQLHDGYQLRHAFNNLTTSFAGKLVIVVFPYSIADVLHVWWRYVATKANSTKKGME